MSKIHETSDSQVEVAPVPDPPAGINKFFLTHPRVSSGDFPLPLPCRSLLSTVPASVTSTARAILLRDAILKVRTHASLGQLCYVNEVNRRPADGRVSELAPLAVPQLSGAVLKFFSIMASRRASTLPLERGLLTSGSSAG